MMLWGVILLVINLALIGSIFYIMLFRRPVRQAYPAVQDELVKKLNDSLSEVKTVFEKLEKKSVDLSAHEKGLRERQRALDELIARAKEAAGRSGEQGDDVYSKAMKMLKSGVPAGEIARNLGLMNGEAELMSSLHRM